MIAPPFVFVAVPPDEVYVRARGGATFPVERQNSRGSGTAMATSLAT